MEGYCANCLRPIGEERYCPHCGYDRMQLLGHSGDDRNDDLYTAPIWVDMPREPETSAVEQRTTRPRRVRKLPILLAVFALAAVCLLTGKSDKEEPVSAPMDVTTPVEITQERIFSFEESDLLVTVDENRVLTVTARNLPLWDTYTVNRSSLPDNSYEYHWNVTCYTPGLHLQFRTYHVKVPKEPENVEKSMADMKSGLFMTNGRGDNDKFFNVSGVKTYMTYGEDSITWSATIPETTDYDPNKPFPVALDSFTGFEIDVAEYRETIGTYSVKNTFYPVS